MQYQFRQVDVFSETPHRGNPLAVVIAADDLTDEQMQTFARWTNLSETTFLLTPTDPDADYRVRIFTPVNELPFAGHPTLGSCQVWLDSGGQARAVQQVVQQCEIGLVPIRAGDGRLAFGAPPLIRSGPIDDETTVELERCLDLDRTNFLASAWADNGPGWVVVLIDGVDVLLSLEPVHSELKIGVVAQCPSGSDAAIELRAFFPVRNAMTEDPVTGSLNAAVAQWLLQAGTLTAPYVAKQGTALDRTGRVYVDQSVDGQIWVGGNTVTTIAGSVTFP